jgi:hypothetical protein
MGAKIDRTPVQSSNIKSVGYDFGTEVLQVEFKNGGVFNYHDVSISAYTAMMEADSIGSHFHNNIKNGYVCRKVDEKEGE